MNRLKYLLFASVLWAAAGCNDDDVADADFKVYASKSDLRIKTAGESFSIIVHARGPWHVAECPEWASIVPTEGDGSCEATVTVTANADYIRRGELRIAYGDCSQTLLLRQNGILVRGLPVRWLFSAANYQSGKYNEAFVLRNALPAETGCGSIGFYQDPQNALTATIERAVEEDTGHPVVCGVLPGDYWLFKAAAEDDVEAGTTLHVYFPTRSSGAGPRYWMLEYRDGEVWLPLGDLREAEIVREIESAAEGGAEDETPEDPRTERITFEYTLDLVQDLTGAKVIGTDNATVNLDFVPERRIPAGTDIEVRLRCVCAIPCVEKNEPETPETPEVPGEDSETPKTEASRADGDAGSEAEVDKGFNRIAGTLNTQPSITVVNTEFAGID